MLRKERNGNVGRAEAEAAVFEVDDALVLAQHVQPKDELHVLVLEDGERAWQEHLPHLF